MNKQQILDWLVADAQTKGPTYKERVTASLQKRLYELNNRRDISLPKNLPRKPEQMLAQLREHFNDNVTLISFILSHYFPNNCTVLEVFHTFRFNEKTLSS